MGTVVLDTSVVLALLDPEDALHSPAATAVRRCHAAGDRLALPAVVLAELLVGAARRGEDELRTRHHQITAAFGSPVPVDAAVAVAAASLRARHRSLRMPDALVLATAEVTAAEVVLTGDKQWAALDPRVELIGLAAGTGEPAPAREDEPGPPG